MNSRPPRPTLFPYTTLFRSRVREAIADRRLIFGGQGRGTGGQGVGRDDVDQEAAAGGQGRGPAGQKSLFQAPIISIHVIDRKSTRLNSSHTVISYAVFCLKK